MGFLWDGFSTVPFLVLALGCNRSLVLSSSGVNCTQTRALAKDPSGEPTKGQVEEALRLAEEQQEGDNNPEDEVVEIPQKVVKVNPEKKGKKDEPEQAEPDSDMSEANESSGRSKSSSSSSSSASLGPAAKGKTSKTKANAEPKTGRGRGRGRGRGVDKSPAPTLPPSRKRPQPIDTSDVKLNPGLTLRLDQARDRIEPSSSAASSKEGQKRRKT